MSYPYPPNAESAPNRFPYGNPQGSPGVPATGPGGGQQGFPQQAAYPDQTVPTQQQIYPQQTAQLPGQPGTDIDGSGQIPQQYATYPTAPVYNYGYARLAAPTDGYSITSFVLGLLGFNIFAIVFGIVGLNRTANGQRAGRGFAIAGIILGTLSLVTIVFFFIFVVSLAGALGGNY